MKNVEKELVNLFKNNEHFGNIGYGGDSKGVLIEFNYKDLTFRIENVINKRLFILAKGNSMESQGIKPDGYCLLPDLGKDSEIVPQIDLVYEFYKYLERNPSSDPMVIDILGDFLKDSDIIVRKNSIVGFRVSDIHPNPTIYLTVSKGEIFFPDSIRCRVDVELSMSKSEVKEIMKLSFNHGLTSFKPARDFSDFLSNPETFCTVNIPELNLGDIKSSQEHLIKALQSCLLVAYMRSTGKLEYISDTYCELVDKIQVELSRYE